MPEEQPPTTDKKASLQAIHTFESDAAVAMQKEHITKEKIAIAESKRKINTPEPEKPRSFIAKTLTLSTKLSGTGTDRFTIPWKLIGVIGIFLAIVTIGTLMYFGVIWKQSSAEPEEVAQPSTPGTPSRVIAFTKDDTRANIIDVLRKKLRDANISVNGLQDLPIRIDSVPATVVTLFDALETRAPSSLKRAIGPQVTYGVHGFRGSQPFLLFPVTSYDHALSGMLSWEKDMADDIGPIFGVSSHAVSMSTGTTTDTALSIDLRFKDAIIRNEDVRALFDPQGAILFLYSFPDKQTLIMTTNEDTFRVLQGKTKNGRLSLPVTQ